MSLGLRNVTFILQLNILLPLFTSLLATKVWYMIPSLIRESKNEALQTEALQ